TTLHRRRVSNTPVRARRLSWHERTDLFRSVIANRQDEVELGRIRPRELIPGLAAQTFDRYLRQLKLTQRLRPYSSHRMASCAVGGKVQLAPGVQNCLGHDRARRISGAQEQDVEVCAHPAYSWLARCAGFTARTKAPM